MTTFTWQIKDRADANVKSFTVERADFNMSTNIKTFSPTSTPDGTDRGTPRFFDFGRKTEGFVLYGVMQSWTEVMDVRHHIAVHWWQKSGTEGVGGTALRGCRLYISSADYHTGQVADFKAYTDRKQGGEACIRYTLTFVIASEFSNALP